MNRDVRLRVVSALVAAPLLVAAVLWLETTLLGLVLSLVLAVAALEWGGLSGFGRARQLAFAGVVLVLTLVVVFEPAIRPPLVTAGALFWVAVAAYALRQPALPDRPRAVEAVPAGLLALVPALAAVLWVHGRPLGAGLVMALLLIVWAADIGAYFAGRTYGKRRLAPVLSPGKTVEGLVGGVLAAVVVAYGSGCLVLDQCRGGPASWLMLAVVTVLASLMGDLFESRAKRIARVKDSGTLMPGHGGVLDRIDSMLAAAPVFAAGLLLAG